ncbi:MAG: fructose-6-phosphate aldolase [Actinobacteria bacterium]|nr:MAG: fructose-6-phosphate aldolase [Actinomycetota bacterium]
MLVLIDSADVAAIAETLSYLPVDGVTTNPTILSKAGREPLPVLREIRELLPARAQLHVQLVSTTTEEMLAEAKALCGELGNDLYVKLPVTRAGYAAIPQVTELGFSVTATGIHSAMQGFMAAKAGAKYIAPYVNRMDNYGIDGVRVARDMHSMLRAHNLDADVLAASFKNSEQVLELVRAGVGAITAAPDVLDHLVNNPATDCAIQDQNDDFAALVGERLTWLDLLDHSE